MVTNCGRDKTHPVGHRLETINSIEYGVSRVAAQATVVITDPTVPAFFRTTAGHLDETAPTVLGMGSYHVRCRNHGRVGHVGVSLLDSPPLAYGLPIAVEVVCRYEIPVPPGNFLQQPIAVADFPDEAKEGRPQALC